MKSEVKQGTGFPAGNSVPADKAERFLSQIKHPGALTILSHSREFNVFRFFSALSFFFFLRGFGTVHVYTKYGNGEVTEWERDPKREKKRVPSASCDD